MLQLGSGCSSAHTSVAAARLPWPPFCASPLCGCLASVPAAAAALLTCGTRRRENCSVVCSVECSGGLWLAWFGLGGSWIFARWTVLRSCEQNATPTLQSGNGGSRMRSGSPSSVRTQSPEQRTSNGCIDRASTQFSGCFDRALSSGCFAQALSLAVASTGHSGAGAPEGVRDQKLGGGGQTP